MILILDGSLKHGAHIFRFGKGSWVHRKSRQNFILYKCTLYRHGGDRLPIMIQIIQSIVLKKKSFLITS